MRLFGSVLLGPEFFNSNRLFHRLADRLEQLLPNAERVGIDAASHIMHEDNPQGFNHGVKLFLLKHSKAA